jgi:hypothetical protein
MARVDNRLMLTVPVHTSNRRHRSSLVDVSGDISPEVGDRGQTATRGAPANRPTSHCGPVMANSYVKLVCQSPEIDRRVTREPVMAW